jgi:hypothetical protein
MTALGKRCCVTRPKARLQAPKTGSGSWPPALLPDQGPEAASFLNVSFDVIDQRIDMRAADQYRPNEHFTAENSDYSGLMTFQMTSHPPHFDAHRVAEMAKLLHTKDWSKTPLGPEETWSASLKLIVSVMLASGFPMCVRWGPELVMIYNDGYRSILGSKHPQAFGLPFQEVWPEVQAQLRPVHEAILNGTSGAYFAEDLLSKVQRHGGLEWEDGRFTVS